MNLDTPKEAASKAAQTVADTTGRAGDKARELGTTATTKVTEYGAAATDTVKGATETTTAKVGDTVKGAGDTVVGATETATAKATELGSSTLTTVTDTAVKVLEQTKDLAEKGVVYVKEFQLGDKSVGERAQATVDTVSERVDVEQISDQVKKARHQMESAVGSWVETFRPSTAEPTEKPAAKKTSTTEKASTTKKPAAKKTTTTKASTTKSA